MPQYRKSRKESGLALLIVLFVVALASILVINMTYSTYLGSRISVAAERSVQAEYLLKSALNFAMAMLKADNTPEDSYKDFWAQFVNGVELPLALLNINLPNVKIELEIRPEGAKINIRSMLDTALGKANPVWRDIWERLCLKLDLEKSEEEDESSPSATPVTCKQLIANLIDYFDPDEEPYDDGGFLGSENEKSSFPNREIQKISEIAGVPGFTATRVQKILPFITSQGASKVNINIAPKLVMQVLHPDLDDNLAEQIVAFRSGEQGPFTNPGQLADIVGSDISDSLTTKVDVRSSRFQVLAKVDYGTATYFLRAYLQKASPDQLPTIESLELF